MNTNINVTEEMLQEVNNSNLSDCLKSLLVAAIANTVAGSRHCHERLGNTQVVYNALSKANQPLTALEIAEEFFAEFGKYEIELERYYDHYLAAKSLLPIVRKPAKFVLQAGNEG